MKKFIFTGILLLTIVQLAVPLSMIAKREKVLHEGELVRFNVDSFDPADIMRGRYIQFELLGDYAKMPFDSTRYLRRNQKVYATIKEDSLGFAYFEWIYTEKPEKGTFIATRFDFAINSGYDRPQGDTFHMVNVHTNTPVKRFYLNENLADIADSLLRYMTEADKYIDVRILDGYPVVEEFYIGDAPLLEYLRKTKLENF